ncbi:hypothetical protein [uncultured Lutibacter sp.]|uniref:hypothetical protein n=1 Tax=uncultured Lutibacter sp. TaxID=437739 RepID=UPI0026052D1B|nr:hypothetical protein [uncultured Lutibacter sp.]
MSKLTKSDIKTILKLYKTDKNITSVARKFCLENENHTYDDGLRRRISEHLERRNLTDNKTRIEDSEEWKLGKGKKLKKSKFYLITYEQNETPLHTNFYNNILAYKNFLNAELSVILGRYKNPTSVFAESKNENWHEETKEYWSASRHDIHDYLTLLADVKISPTMKYPLTGIQGLSQGKSIIVGHPKLHLKTEPTLNGYANKTVLTTGAITLPNYTDSRQGKIAENSHKFGFVIVEIRNETIFHIRQVEADKDGNFIDLIHKVHNQVINIVENAEGLVCGDSHGNQIIPEIDKANDTICERFNIKKLVMHDVVDGESCNNHILKDPIQQYERLQNDSHLIEKELHELKNWLKPKLKYGIVIPSANHNDRFDRILQQDWRKDIANSLFYFKYTTAVMEKKAEKGVVAYYLHNEFGDEITTLSTQDSYIIGKYECALHGDNGTNGSRGSNTGFRNLDIPMIVAHTHSTYRADDLFYVGHNILPQKYASKGASSWSVSNVLIAENGIGQHLIFTKGDFTTFDLTLIKK